MMMMQLVVGLVGDRIKQVNPRRQSVSSVALSGEKSLPHVKIAGESTKKSLLQVDFRLRRSVIYG